MNTGGKPPVGDIDGDGDSSARPTAGEEIHTTSDKTPHARPTSPTITKASIKTEPGLQGKLMLCIS